MSAILTIAVPTYNRPEQLKTLLASLMPQLTSRTVLQILDNASDVPVENVLDNWESLSTPPRLEVIRHPVNIGGAANLLRCYEVCRTPWLWIIGDDDVVLEGAIDRVLTAIDSTPDAVLVNFTIDRFRRDRAWRSEGLSEFLQNIDFLDAVIFTPNNILNVFRLWPYLKYGYLYSYSFMPHLATLLKALEAGGGCHFETGSVVRNPEVRPVKDQYSCLAYCMGAGVILDLVTCDADRKRLAALLLHGNIFFAKFLFHLALARLHGTSSTSIAYLRDQTRGRWFAYAPTTYRMVFAVSAALARACPRLFARLVIEGAKRWYSRALTYEDLPDADARL